MNKIFLIGHLGKEPEVRKVNDTTVCNISLATSEKRKDETEVTEWHNCVFWGKAAEAMQKYAQKGTHLFIEGKLRTRSYDSNGAKKYVTEVIVSSFELLGNYRKPHVGGSDYSNDKPVETTYSERTDEQPF